MSGFFAPQQALAAANVTPASEGTNISIDTTAPSGTGVFTELSGPAIAETVAGDIAAGTHTISLPSGWEFDITSNITISKFGGNIVLGSTSVTPAQTSFSFVVNSQSTLSGSILGFSNLKVRPTVTIAPSTGNMTHSGAGIVGVDGSTNFGTLSTVPGTVVKLAFTTQPGGAVYGSFLSPQPVVKTQDQFSNNSTNGLIAIEMVSLTLTGTGMLQGTVSLNIGTGGGTPGTVTFTDLKVSDVGAVGTKGLTALAGVLTDAVSGPFVISQKPITATVTVNSKPYDGNNSAVITGVTLNGVEVGDDVTVNNQGTATFASSNANTGIVVTSNGVTITGAHAGNYSFGGTAAGNGTITPLEITITPTAGQTKIYGQDDPTFDYDFTPALIVPDNFTGALSRSAGEDVGTYAYTLGDLSADSNYLLTLAPGTFEITQKPLTVTATGVNREYDQTTNATVTLSSNDEVSGDNLVYAYTSALFLTKTAENNKTVNVSGISISGAKSGNYNLQNTEAVATANITKKPITATLNLNNKVYDGDTSAAFSIGVHIVLNDLIGGDDVIVANEGSKAFIDKHIGTGKTVNATGIILGGADVGNYEFNGAGTGTANITERPITVTAVTDTKTYNGTMNSAGTPIPNALQGTDTANFTQTYDNKNVGTVKTLTPSGAVSDGNGGANYSYTFVTNTTGVITEKSINVTAQPDTKIYDGTKSSIVVPVVDALEIGDTITTAPTQEYDTKNVGITKTLIASGLIVNDGFGGANYLVTYVDNLTGVINAKALTVTGATTNSKIYNGDATATVNFGLATLVGKIAGEEALVSLNSAGSSATYDDKNVGVGKTVTVSGLALAGAGASNYSLTQPTLNDGVITKRPITITAAANTKPYDGLTIAAAIPTITAGTLASGDVGTFTETYDNANVGTTHVLTPAGTIADVGSADMTGNYNIAFTSIATGVIDKAPLVITAENKSKVYGATLPVLTASYSGFVNGETATVLDTPVSLSTTAVDASPVSTYPITASGAADVNYNISFVSGTLTVTPAPLTVTADAKTKIYGDADPELTYVITFGSLINGDTLIGSLSRVVGVNVGAYAITSTLANPNYGITFVSANLTINKKSITVTAVTNTKTYDGNTSAAGTPTFTGSLVGTDTAGFTQSYDNKNVGTGKTLTPSGIVNDGNSGLNYSYTFVTNTTGVITPLGITVTPTIEQTKIYDTTDPVFAYTSDPLISPDSFTGVLSRMEGENVGTYAYTLGTLADGLGNYTLTLTSGTFAITKAMPVITWANPANIVYGTALSGTELNATADVAGAFVYTPTTGTVLNAGVGQTLSVTFTPTDTVNYNSKTQGALITVAPKSLTVTADDKSKEYGAPDPALTYTYSGLVNGDTNAVFTGALTRDSGENVGTYDINQGTVLAGNNYAITYESGTFTIEDTVNPTLLSHIPSVNAVNVAVGSNITITFSEPVNVAEGAITLNPGTSFTMSGDGTNVITLTPTSVWDDNTIYTVTVTEGVADVNGNALTNPTSWTFTTATSYSISLNANAGGWNLISLPVVPTNKNVSVVLSGVESSVEAVWAYDPTNLNAVDGWLVYVPGNPEGTNNLTIMTAGYGYWISATGNATISGSGSLFSPQVTPPERNLVAGWNLIGYYQHSGESESTPVAAFVSLGDSYTGPFGFNNSDGAFIWPVTQILPGDAFWVSLPSAKTYTPGTPNL